MATTKTGQVLHRSFAEPWGAEFHVATLRALLRSRQEATDAMEPMEPWIVFIEPMDDGR